MFMFVWLFAGLVSTCVAISVSRPGVCEMYATAIAPFFGFLTVGVVIVDIVRIRRGEEVS